MLITANVAVAVVILIVAVIVAVTIIHIADVAIIAVNWRAL